MGMCRIILFLFLLPFCANGQTINTFAGGGTHGLGDSGPATAAGITDPAGSAFDKIGNFYVACPVDHRVRKIDTFGIIRTLAGTGISGYTGDGGQATAAELNIPLDVAVDSLGNIYISESGNNTIRKVDGLTGVITTVCGNGSTGSSGDGGPATAALLYDPNGICFDKYGNLYIVDLFNEKIRKINTDGVITTFAGTGGVGVTGFSGDGGPATAAQFWTPATVTSDGTGNIYIADQGNARIRKVDTMGFISTFAGDGINTYIGDSMPALTAQFSPDWVRRDAANNIYIGDNMNNRVYKVDTDGIFYNIAGNGTMSGFSGDGGPATDAEIYYPSGLAFDRCGNLYISDVNNNRVRKVTYNPTCDPYSNTNASLQAKTVDLKSAVSIYPNPAYEQLAITSSSTIYEVTLSNVIGQQVFDQVYDVKKVEVNVSGLPPGVYVVRVTDGEGNAFVRKVLKE